MNKIVLIAIILLVVVGIIIGIVAWGYGSLVSSNENANAAWGKVQSKLQRRFDLIPAFVNATRGYMQFEERLLTNITMLRSQWGAAMNTGDVDKQIEASNMLSIELGKIVSVVENYPDLKSIEAVKTLMDELAGTENRISTERDNYTDAVRGHNVNMAWWGWSNNLLGWGFKTKQYYEAVPGAETPPPVSLT